MPFYGKRSEKYAPAPTEEIETTEKRFTMPVLPRLSVVQMIFLGLTLWYMWSTRKLNTPTRIGGTIAIVIGLLHMYDHLFRVTRGPEKLLFGPKISAKKEGYCSMCK